MSEKPFAEQLLACEKSTPGHREQYEKELRAMLDNKLTVNQKKEWLCASIAICWIAMMMVFIGVQSFTAMTADFWLPGFVGTVCVLSALALLMAAGFLVVACWRGVVDRPRHGKIVASIVVTYLGLVGGILMLAYHHTPEGFRFEVMVVGFVLLLYAATAWVRQRIGQAELKTREQLLEIELRLAELADVVKPSVRKEI